MWQNLGLGRKNKHLDKWKARGFQNGQKSQDSADPFECDFKPCCGPSMDSQVFSSSTTEIRKQHRGRAQASGKSPGKARDLEAV